MCLKREHENRIIQKAFFLFHCHLIEQKISSLFACNYQFQATFFLSERSKPFPLINQKISLFFPLHLSLSLCFHPSRTYVSVSPLAVFLNSSLIFASEVSSPSRTHCCSQSILCSRKNMTHLEHSSQYQASRQHSPYY